MRRRIGEAGSTGLGNPSEELMSGESTGNKKRDALINECSKEAYEVFFKGKKARGIDLGGVDAGVRDFEVRIGVEPSYMYWPLKMIVIHERKMLSRLITGYSWEAWGSGLRLKKRWYRDYKHKSKFVRFVDKWHPKLFPV